MIMDSSLVVRLARASQGSNLTGDLGVSNPNMLLCNLHVSVVHHVITSVMIYHRRASLSEQHTHLLICHCI